MAFDNPTLFNLLLLQGVAAALVLGLLVGRHGSSAARWAQAGMAAQALGWLALAGSAGTPNPLLLPLALCSFSAALSALWWATQLWLRGRSRVGCWLMVSAPVLLLLGDAWLTDTGAPRVAWAQAWLAGQLLMLAATALLPQAASNPPLSEVQIRSGRRWRALLGAATLPLALVCLARGAEAITGLDINHRVLSNTALALAALLGLCLLLPALLLAWRAEVEGQLAQLARSDRLTGLPERRAFAEQAVHMISMARRHKESLVMLLLDIDLLTRINAAHGRDAGDRALALFGQCLQSQLRLGDLAGRVGGEEFAVLMARADSFGPAALDQRMRAALATQAIATLGFALDFSAGWATLRAGDRHLDDLMQRAEAALYMAKCEGRGCLVAEPGC